MLTSSPEGGARRRLSPDLLLAEEVAVAARTIQGPQHLEPRPYGCPLVPPRAPSDGHLCHFTEEEVALGSDSRALGTSDPPAPQL